MPATNNLLALRQQKKMTAELLCTVSGVSRTIIGMVERANYYPGYDVRARLARALGVDQLAIWPAGEQVGVTVEQ